MRAAPPSLLDLAHRSTWRSVLAWVLLLLVFAPLSGVARAQGVAPEGEPWQLLPDFVRLGSDPLFFAAWLSGLVAWLRKTTIGSKLDGAVRVGAVTVAVGMVAGAALQYATLVVYAPFAAWTFPWGGLAYGAFCASGAVFGVSLIVYVGEKLLTKRAAPVIVNVPPQVTR